MTTYLYIDDDTLQNSQEKVSAIVVKDYLQIMVEQNLRVWEQQMKRLKNKDYDGLILDLKLDEMPVEDRRHAEYRGTTVAQQVRDHQKEGSMMAFPMILFTGEENMKNALDNTGRDLFDMIIEKGSLTPQTASVIPIQLSELSNFYKQLNTGADARNLIKAQYYVDERFMDALYKKQTEDSIASCAHFFLNEFIMKSGLLVDEALLAARLGVDKDKTGLEWGKIRSLFDDAHYNGVLGKGWNRWWMHGINERWKSLTGTNLQRIGAEERVALLKSILKIEGIVMATKTKYAESDEYWAVCCGTGKPLDPIDGFEVTGQETSYPWQDLQYVSKEAAFHKTKIKLWKDVASSEKERLEYLKQEYERR